MLDRFFHALGLAGVLLILCSSPPSASAAEDDAATLRVLFVGNSYISFNNLPAMVQSLSVAAKEKRALEFGMITPGGCTLQRHYDDARVGTRAAIKETRWHYVVLQEQSQMPLMYPNEMHKYGLLLGSFVKEQNATPLFYMAWARENEASKQAAIRDAYCKVADELKAPCAPIGLAWEAARKQRPALKLYNKDQSHPSPSGSYLAACVTYAMLYEKSPQGLPGKLIWKKDGKSLTLCDVPVTEAGFLQKIAWESVKAEGERKK